ncbi:MAG TPA: Gfo/Idh/MocA family oxidoreductase, partial [Blastocatellia bacterium]|nr:Gfo/Idh/MocA family oxidoreductase [Blastocatellia bacterium]
MERIKIGIVGAGYIGGVHGSLLARDERVRIVAVNDLASDRSERLARSTGAQIAGTVEELIDGADAVYITTPNTKHMAPALAAIAAGKHVFCEKPLATSLVDARAVLDAASGRNAV